MSLRLVVAAALAVVCHGALAQTVPATVTVQQIAPQLVTFAGSPLNFQSLVNGLAQGTPVQLISVLPTGFTQTVTFTPATTLTPNQIAQVLETARQQLIGLGIGAPTAEQLGIALMGGTVPTALGGSQVAGVLNLNPPSPAAQIQGSAGAGATASPVGQINVQIQPSRISATPPATSTSSTAAPRNTSDSLAPAGTTSRSAAAGSTSATPAPVTPAPAPGIGSTPPAAEPVPPGRPRARN